LTKHTPSAVPRRNIVVGYLLFTVIICVIVADLLPVLSKPITWLAIVCGWTAAALLVSRTRLAQRCLVGGMVVIGCWALWAVHSSGATAPWTTAVSQSLPLITMIMSVGFMKRIARAAISSDAPLPTGPKAYRDSVLTIALFGAFINISVVMIVGDRLSEREPLSLFNTAVLTRAFSSCVNWSPFFAGLAVVISYSPAFSLPVVMAQGIPIALASLLLMFAFAKQHPAELAEFRGFPVKWTSLWVPSLLAIAVLALHWLLPSASLLPVIAMASLSVVVVFQLFHVGAQATVRSLHEHIVTELPLSVNELVLLLGVGVLAAGLVARAQLGDVIFHPPPFDGIVAVAVLAVMIIIAMLGIHPVVTIALIASLLVPVQPDPELLASTLLLGWSLGTLACPLSGMHLIMQGRYGLPSWQAALSHWPFVGLMFLLGSAWLQLLAWWNLG